MIEILPAILPRDYDDLAACLGALRGVTSVVQVDVVDGIFAPRVTWPYNDMGRFHRILAEEEGLPFWEDFSFEADLMVQSARRDAEGWVTVGASRVVIHVESPDAGEALTYLRSVREGTFGIETGVALSLETPLEELKKYEGMYDYVQLMGIAHIGRQGEELENQIYARIQELRRSYGGTISIDGGVKASAAHALVAAGATRLIAGSAIIRAEDPREAYDELLQQANFQPHV